MKNISICHKSICNAFC